MELDKAPQLAIENVSIGHLAALAPETVSRILRVHNIKFMKTHKQCIGHFGRFGWHGMLNYDFSF